jgi:hypothetical protein
MSAEDSASSNVYLNSASLIELKVLFEMIDTLQHGNFVILCSSQRRKERSMLRSCCSATCDLVSANKPFDEFILILLWGTPVKVQAVTISRHIDPSYNSQMVNRPQVCCVGSTRNSCVFDVMH